MIEGDSGFGFSAMELETAARYKMPLKCIIINNSGIMFGSQSNDVEHVNDVVASWLSSNAKYEMIAQAFGGKGRSVETPQELEEALAEMLSDNNLWVLNVIIDPNATVKPAKFSWLTTSKDIAP